MENGSLNRGKITVEDMISKLKDDGDYDRLRLKIVRKVRDDVSAPVYMMDSILFLCVDLL